MSERTVRVFVSGRVQGVWFRGWTCEQARRLGLSGWVRNRVDGRVEVPAEAVTSVCLGGPDRRDLYVATADNRDDPAARAATAVAAFSVEKGKDFVVAGVSLTVGISIEETKRATRRRG